MILASLILTAALAGAPQSTNYGEVCIQNDPARAQVKDDGPDFDLIDITDGTTYLGRVYVGGYPMMRDHNGSLTTKGDQARLVEPGDSQKGQYLGVPVKAGWAYYHVMPATPETAGTLLKIVYFCADGVPPALVPAS